MTSAPIECLHMNHINVVVEHFDESVDHFRDLYGAQFVMDVPNDEWHACLIVIGGVIIELFVPTEYLLNARYGPHYVGIEYQVPDVGVARDAAGEWGIRIVRDLEHTIHTHPVDSCGIGLEFFGRNFHTDPKVPWLEPFEPAEYWRDEHPLGCTGLKRYSIAVADLDATTTFLQDFVGATVLYHEPRPAVEGRAVGLALADTVAEVIAPVADGPIQRHVDRYGDGIRSTVFAVRDLQQAQAHFAEHAITLRPGDAPGSLAIAPDDNHGILFEFSE